MNFVKDKYPAEDSVNSWTVSDPDGIVVVGIDQNKYTDKFRVCIIIYDISVFNDEADTFDEAKALLIKEVSELLRAFNNVS